MNAVSFRGSTWNRWEPHIHTPGTILNNQFSGPDGGWDDYVNRINSSDPKIRALGITDYLSVSNYEKVVKLKRDGRLPDVLLIFPNIELRFDIGTASNSALNGHLLVSPEDPEHIRMIERFLNKLTFNAHGQKYTCNIADLILLGRKHRDDTSLEENAALCEGTNQFKVNFDELIEQFHSDAWALENVLLGIAVNTGDGTSGLSTDASFASVRKKMEAKAQIIFASSESQRTFWLGKGVEPKERIIQIYGSCKPCIHGSDAHENDKVGKPHGARFTWIKGDLSFESLRQICIEPEGRVLVGQSPPADNVSSQTIGQVTVTNAEWLRPSLLEINPGFVAVIGARGSGKTALADLIAAGGSAISNQLTDRSFIERAREYLDDVAVDLQWASGVTTSNQISQIGNNLDFPRVQYLSQQFVDKLCSAEGVTDELLQEVERVIFQAHPESDRLAMSNFQDLLSFRSSNARAARQQGEELLENLSKLIAAERKKRNSVEKLTKIVADKSAVVAADKSARQSLVRSGQNERLSLHQQVSNALETVKRKLDVANRRHQTLLNLKAHVTTTRASTFAAALVKLKQTYGEASLTPDQWNEFKTDFIGNIDALIDQEILSASNDIRTITGSMPIDAGITGSSPAFISDYTALNDQPFNLLKNEFRRLELVIGVDTSNQERYSRLSLKISKDEVELEKIKRELQDAQGAASRIVELNLQKKEAYKSVFDAILKEEQELVQLYQPLLQNLSNQEGTLRRLTFSVRRTADTEAWAGNGEDLLDLRKQGDFRGHGTLLTAVNIELKNVWETGTSDQIAQAVNDFRNKYESTILDHCPVDREDVSAFNSWGTAISDWLYSTAHVYIKYGIQYDGVDLQQLSPGTRGIVLLLLYLAIDQEDERPLIIDQPEENLDPRSIFNELVPLFTEVKKRRQVIIITHNANLVVNTDADQVIVAKGGDHRPNQLPVIEYVSGGLENSQIRKSVCEILEGGEEAFKERARRLRVTLKN